MFSISTAKGIEFYKNKKFDGFTESEETIKFTLMINHMFDALNRKFPIEGIKKNSEDLEVFYTIICFHCCDLWLRFKIS